MFWGIFFGHAPFGHALLGMPFLGMPFRACPSGMPLRGAPLRGALGRAPPPVCRAEILKKFRGKSVPENYTLFFGKNDVFGHFTYQIALGPI